MRIRGGRRSLLLLTIAGLASAGLVTGGQAAAAETSVTLPSSPGHNKVTFSGHAPFNNGQANLLFDDATGACDPTDPNGKVFRDEHKVRVKVPTKPAPRYDVLIRFQIDWTPLTPEFTQDMRMDLFGPDGKLVASSDGSQTSEGISLTAANAGLYDMVVCAFQTGPTGQDYKGSVTASVLKPPAAPQATNVKAPTYQ